MLSATRLSIRGDISNLEFLLSRSSPPPSSGDSKVGKILTMNKGFKYLIKNRNHVHPLCYKRSKWVQQWRPEKYLRKKQHQKEIIIIE